MSNKNKGASLGLIYLIGMTVAIFGFCRPMFKGIFGSGANGFRFISFDNFGFVTIGALALFAGAVAGVVFAILAMCKLKIPAKTLGLIALLVMLAGAIILFIGFTTDNFYKVIGKGFLKHATYGFYMVIGGWVVGLIGWFIGK